MRCWPNHQQVSAIYHSNSISRSLHILNASLNQTYRQNVYTSTHHKPNYHLINPDANFLFKGNLFYTPVIYLLNSILTLNVPVPYKYGSHQCVEPRFHALEPHFPRASHSHPAHSSRGSEASTQLAFPRKPRFRAFPRSCGPQFRAFPCNWKQQFRAFPRN